MSFRRTRRSSVVAFVVAIAMAKSALAQGDPSASRAQQLFDEGVKLLERGEWADACAKLSESHALDPAGGTALDIGFCEEKRGFLASAIAAYQDALRLARADGRADRIAVAEEKIAALGKRTSRVRVKLAPVVASLPGVAVAVDGKPIAGADVDTPVPVDPGKRVVTVRATGKRAASREVWISGEATLSEVDFGFLDDEDAPPPPDDRPRLEALAADAVRADRERKRRTLGLALGGGGLAFVAAGIVTGIAAANAHADSNRECTGGCTQAGVDAEDRANALAWVSNGGFVVGGVLVAVGVYFLATKPAVVKTVRADRGGFVVLF